MRQLTQRHNLILMVAIWLATVSSMLCAMSCMMDLFGNRSNRNMIKATLALDVSSLLATAFAILLALASKYFEKGNGNVQPLFSHKASKITIYITLLVLYYSSTTFRNLAKAGKYFHDDGGPACCDIKLIIPVLLHIIAFLGAIVLKF